MFAVFLPSLNFRGNRTPYLWWFYKLLNEFDRDAGFICGEEYFIEPEQLLASGCKDASADIAALYGYRLPDRETLAQLRRADIPPDVWLRLESAYPSDPLAAFRNFCLSHDDELHQAISSAVNVLELNANVIEVVVTCVNCATLRNFCHARNLPLLHLELGPLRSPVYLHTAYLDFSGVNGNTESRRRFEAARNNTTTADEWRDASLLRSLFMMKKLPMQDCQKIDLGLGLQIEDDSNIICYANGHSSLSLINASRRMLADQKVTPPVLVRPHPGSFFTVQNLPSGLKLDNSKTSVDFLLKCKRIHTINSGLTVESMLIGLDVTVYGESPFSFCINPESGKCNIDAFSFFLLNYLVPWHLALKPEYIRWRLGKPSEAAIKQRHLETLMQRKIQLLEEHITELENSLSKQEMLLAQMRSSFAWRLTYPFRKIFQLLHRLLKLSHL